ncbi:MAG: hypothetical protein EA424_05965 [Planctomycetaceae bacterium]|nr:MAG: hypothetical protein EA424_05965 [Planctomycetaceae bacterium]
MRGTAAERLHESRVTPSTKSPRHADLLIEIGCRSRYGIPSFVFRVRSMAVLWIANSLHRFMPQDSPAWYLWGDCGLFLLITWLFVRALQRSGIYIRI